jgi:hypothetical protein
MEHPLKSAVIARHQAARHTHPDSTVEEWCKKIEEKLTAISRKQDALESPLVKLEAKKVEPPTKKGGERESRQGQGAHSQWQ